MSTYWTCRCREMLGRLIREDDNIVDKRYRWMLGHLARAKDSEVDKRRVWDFWQNALHVAHVYDAGYQARRDEHFPQVDWDYAPDEATVVANRNAYDTLIREQLHFASKGIDRVLRCQDVLLEGCRKLEADWRREAATLDLQLVPAAVTPFPSSLGDDALDAHRTPKRPRRLDDA